MFYINKSNPFADLLPSTPPKHFADSFALFHETESQLSVRTKRSTAEANGDLSTEGVLTVALELFELFMAEKAKN